MRVNASPIWMFVVVVLFALAWNAYHFADDDYREDEIYTINYAATMSAREVMRFLTVEIHPPLWRVSAMAWIDVVGVDRVPVRYFSWLANALALAFVFRLGTDLFEWRAGLAAAFILAIWPYPVYYMSELRPYPFMMGQSAALLLFLLRWARHQNFRYAFLFVLTGIISVFTHYFMIVVVMGLAASLTLLVRLSMWRWVKAMVLFALVAVSLSSWMYTVLTLPYLSVRPDGLFYAFSTSIEGVILLLFVLNRAFLFAGFLILFLIVWPLINRRRPNSDVSGLPLRIAPRAFIVTTVALIFVIAFTLNTIRPIVTQRNFSAVFPLLALWVGSLLIRWRMPWVAVAVIGFIVTAFVGTSRWEVTMPLTAVAGEMDDYYSSGDVVVIAPEVPETAGAHAVALAMYLRQMSPHALSREDIRFVAPQIERMMGSVALEALVIDSPTFRSSSQAGVSEFFTSVGGATQVIYIEIDDPNASTELGPRADDTLFRQALLEQYEPVHEGVHWSDPPVISYTVVVYRQR